MTTLVTADVLRPSVDSTAITVDQGYGGVIPRGWPCAGLPDDPPSVADRQSNPTADDLLPQVLALTPRGPAWGTDEAGDGRGASPILRLFWRAVASWSAENNARDFEVATQAFPSAISFSLLDWERELGLPDPCFQGGAGDDARIAAVRARFGALGGQSPAYFICLAASVGYAITIEEPTQFLVDVSEVGPDPIAEDWFLVDDGELAPDSVAEVWFQIDDGELALDSIVGGALQPEGDGTALEGFVLLPEGDGTPLESYHLTGLDEDLDAVSDETQWRIWIVHVASLGETWFRIDDGELTVDSLVGGVLQPEGPGTPLEGFLTAQDLECLLRRYAPEHTDLVFAYD